MFAQTLQRRLFSQGPRRLKKVKSSNLYMQLSPHILVAAGLCATANVHLLPVPFTTAALHYLYHYNHLKKLTLYYDLQALGRNENYVATFGKVREVLMTDERFNLYIEQTTDAEERATTLLFENPTFMPFAFQPSVCQPPQLNSKRSNPSLGSLLFRLSHLSERPSPSVSSR